ncbi:hypothetical protein [Orrella marina]|nr:hypothetical protein [Orrella marina]
MNDVYGRVAHLIYIRQTAFLRVLALRIDEGVSDDILGLIYSPC